MPVASEEEKRRSPDAGAGDPPADRVRAGRGGDRDGRSSRVPGMDCGRSASARPDSWDFGWRPRAGLLRCAPTCRSRSARTAGRAAARVLSAGDAAHASLTLRRRRAGGAAAAGRVVARRPRAHGRLVAELGLASSIRRPLPRDGDSERARPPAHGLRSLGCGRRRADHLAARADRRAAQLGLPLLLAARRLAHRARARRPGLHGRGARLRELAAARHPTDSARAPRALRRARQQAARRAHAGSPGRLSRDRGRSGSATRPPSSCSSMSTAR